MSRKAITATDAAAINAILYAVRQAADVICDRWALALIVAAFLGERRFNGFMARTGMASRLVTSRLRTLETLGLFVRIPYSIRPLRHEYQLSVMGREFGAVILQMIRWERSWCAGEDQSLPLVHLECGAPLNLEVRCKACRNPASARNIDLAVSQTRLRQMPAKQTLHRRSTLEHEESRGIGGMLGPSLAIFGDKWSVEIIMCCFFRVRRFSDFRERTGIAANILVDRLERLIRARVLRRAASESDPAGREYRLTEQGVDLFGTLVALQDWADAWVRERYRSPVRLTHRPCREPLHILPVCANCDRDVSFDSVSFAAGAVQDRSRRQLA